MTIKTNPPRDPSDMASNSRTGLYTGVAIAFVIIAGFLIVSSYQPAPTNSPTQATPPVTAPK